MHFLLPLPCLPFFSHLSMEAIQIIPRCKGDFLERVRPPADRWLHPYECAGLQDSRCVEQQDDGKNKIYTCIRAG